MVVLSAVYNTMFIARLKLKESIGCACEKFVDLGLNSMGECIWAEEEEQLFHDVVYSHPVSFGNIFWEQLSIAFPFRTKELVSYDDEWWGSKKGVSEDFVVVGPLVDHGYSSENCDENGDVEGDMVMGIKEPYRKQIDRSESEQEKGKNGGLRSESYLHWDPPYSTMGSTKGVDLLPACSMIKEIFGSSQAGKNI